MFRTKWHTKSCGAGVSLAVGKTHVVEVLGRNSWKTDQEWQRKLKLQCCKTNVSV